MLGGLQGDVDTGQGAELPGPHTRAIDHELGLHGPLIGDHTGDPASRAGHPGGGHALEDGGSAHAGSPGQRHGHAHRVGPALVGHHEPTHHVVGLEQGPVAGNLLFREGVILHPEALYEQRLAVERLHPLRAGGNRDMADGPEAGGEAGLLLEPLVEIARIAAHEQGGLVHHARRGDQAGGVPGRPRSEPVALEEHDVAPTQRGQVVGDAGPDDPATHDDHLGPLRHGSGPGRSLGGRGSAGGWISLMRLDAASRRDGAPRPRWWSRRRARAGCGWRQAGPTDGPGWRR